MSKPRYDWWQYAIRIGEKWPMLQEQYTDLHQQAITPNMSGMPGGGSVSRAVEDVALRTLPGNMQKEYEAAVFALEEIMNKPEAGKQMQVVKLRFWDGTMTIAGAAMKVGYAERTARRICWRYILSIGRGMGFITDEEYRAALKSENN